MNEAYVECLVKKKRSPIMVILKLILIILAVVLGLLGMVSFSGLFFLIAIIFGVGAYLLNLYCDIEYEYLYVDKELSVDKVFAKSRRKKAAAFDVGKIEIMAPIHSYHLDNYKNRQIKAVDYSSYEEKQPDLRYVFYYDGKQKIIFEPNEEMIKAIQFVAPRKVFTE